MQFTAAQIALLIQGKTEGDASVAVSSFGKIEEAQEGELAFLANPKYEEYLYTTKASIVLVNEDLELKENISATLIRVPDAYSAFATLLTKYQEIATQQLSGIQQPSYISQSAKLGENIFVAAFSYIGENVKIGNNVKLFAGVFVGDNVSIDDNTILQPGVKIYHNCILGKNVTIHAGTVVGSDGFGFAPLADGSFKKIPQIGNVIIEDDVEIGANCAIDRATLGSTILRKGVKFDNLIHIAHNVEVGENSFLAACNVVAGSTKIGKSCMFSGQVGIVGHLQIADNTVVTAQSGISKSITKKGQVISGSPGFEAAKYRKAFIHFRNLESIVQRIDHLEKENKK